MNYTSTRGNSQPASLAEIISRGTAADGGLYLPETWPTLSQQQLAQLQSGSYAETAINTLMHFGADSLPDGLLLSAIPAAMQNFGAAATPPLNKIEDNLYSLELFHGPTLAFKDYALAPLAEILARKLSHTGQQATVLCATSGDTGAATVSAFANRERLNVVVLFPAGGVSEFQRRQMTTLGAANVLALCINGDFDDCQRIVKALYQTPQAQLHGYTAVNSINMVRILLQCAYYFYAAGKIYRDCGKSAGFIVPTGNFGNVYAAYIAKQMGAPIGSLTITSNENDVLPRLFETGVMQATQTHKTISPSMDIQVSSNFERLLWHIKQQSGSDVAHAQQQLTDNRQYRLSSAELATTRANFTATRCSTQEAFEAMRWMWKIHNKIICPHSATAVHAAGNLLKTTDLSKQQLVVVETAHPVKFSAAVEQAIGTTATLPPAQADLMQVEEKYHTIDADLASIQLAIDQHLG